MLDLLISLVDKSLVVCDAGAEAGRYRLLESVRQYAWEKLRQSGEEEQIRDRHRAWCLGLAEAAREKLRGPEQALWLQRLETEYDNCRASLEFCGEDPAGGETGLRLAAALQDFWRILGYVSEGRQHLHAALAHSGVPAASTVRASALHGAGMLSFMQGDYASAHARFTESLAIRRELENKRGIAFALESLASLAHACEPERAVCLYAAADALRHAIGSPLSASGQQTYEHNLAVVRNALGKTTFTAAWAEGQSKTLLQAIDYAVE